MEQDELSQEQILFYEKVASYVGKHPEFIEELQRKMEEEENTIKNEKVKGKSKEKYSSTNKNYAGNYAGNENDAQNTQNAQKKDPKIKEIFKLDDDKINTISRELSSMLFDKDASNKSILEKTVQDAFSSMVKNYLSKYAG